MLVRLPGGTDDDRPAGPALVEPPTKLEAGDKLTRLIERYIQRICQVFRIGLVQDSPLTVFLEDAVSHLHDVFAPGSNAKQYGNNLGQA
jgi:hypothetical protein